MNDFNYTEYAVDQKTEGKYLYLRIGLIVGYVLFSVLWFLGMYAAGIVQLVAILPLLLWIVIWFSWKYVQVIHEYTVTSDSISFSEIYGNRARRQVLTIPLKQIIAVFPVGKKEPPTVDLVKDFRGSRKTPDAYCLLGTDEKDRMCLVYFEATGRALRLMALHVPSAVDRSGPTRY